MGRYRADRYRSDMRDQPQESHLYRESRNGKIMDRYTLAREFKMTLAQERVRKIDDVFALQQLCCELLSSNFQLRESLRQSVAAEIPKKTTF